MDKIKKNKHFGYLFFFFLFVFSILNFFISNKTNYISISLSIIFLVITIFKPMLFDRLSNVWIKLGELLGKVIAPIIMAIIFFAFITPISFIIKIMGKDLLNTKFSKKKSYWVKREKDIGSMDRQF